jgi:uncharacterized protein
VALPESRSDILELVERGDLRSSSFAFQTHEDQWGITDGGVALRTLVSGRLIDVAPVSSPAYADTTVAMRSWHGTRPRRSRMFSSGRRLTSFESSLFARIIVCDAIIERRNG